jgi:hypothetical protein
LKKFWQTFFQNRACKSTQFFLTKTTKFKEKITMSVDVSHFYKTTLDWQAKSIGDISAFGGIGGGVKHLAIWSPSLNQGIHSMVVFGGGGVEAKAKIPKVKELLGDSYDFVKDYIDYSAKGVQGTLSAAGGYEPMTVFRAFSLYDFSVSQIVQAEASAAVVAGVKSEGLTAYCGLRPIFSITQAIAVGWGLGAGAQTSVGFIITTIPHQISTAKKFQMEQKRKPTDIFPTPAGGRIM